MKNSFFTRIIGLFLLVGGVFGVLFWFNYNISRIHDINNIFTLITSIFALLVYILTIISGHLILKGSKSGFIIAFVTQLIQIPVFAEGHILYYFSTFFRALGVVIIAPNNISLDFSQGFGSNFSFFTRNMANGVFIGINFIALIAAFYLLKNILKASRTYGHPQSEIHTSGERRGYTSREFIR